MKYKVRINTSSLPRISTRTLDKHAIYFSIDTKSLIANDPYWQQILNLINYLYKSNYLK